MTATTDRRAPTSSPKDDPATFRVALGFEDGVTRFITCRADQTVADASYRQRINIPLDCRDGACGTCKSLCESGDYDGGTYIDDALSPAEADDGYVLPCSMKPRSDLVLQIPATSDIAKTQAATFSGELVELERLSASTVRIAVHIPNRDELAFLPGQYVNITVPGATGPDGAPATRSYSFSNDPDDPRLTFLMKLSPGGAMSTYLTDRAAVGDALTFTGPHGSFFLRESSRPVLMLAGGTGLAPVLSMLRTLRSNGSERAVHLIYGVSSDIDLVAVDEIDSIAADLPHFTWDHCVSDPASTAANKGYVTSLMAAEHLYGGDVAIYLCGPPPMVESVRGHLADTGVEPTGFYYEKFALATAPKAPAADTTPAVTTVEADTDTEAARHDVANTIKIDSAAIGSSAPELLLTPDARSVSGQNMLPRKQFDDWTGSRAATGDDESKLQVAGQAIWPSAGTSSSTLDEDTDLPAGAGRTVAGQEIFGARQLNPLVAAAEVAPAVEDTDSVVGSQGYVIGEEHPAIHESDALFEARAALELGALELTLGRMTSRQLAGYRLLAESTVPYVSGETFVDAEQYTETNAAFHDYLFVQTGNPHLLEAYRALGVKGRMSDVLRHATWCHPLCAQDHVDIVAAFESGDRVAARELIAAHGERSKQTMRRAMSDEISSHRPRFITPGRFACQVVVVTGAAQGIGAQTARRIAAEGGRLVLVDRSDLVSELRDELGATGEAIAVTADLEHYDGADAVARRAVAEFGRVDVLINNVGGAINFKPFIEFSDAEIRAELDRSLLTTLYTCRAVLPGMVERGHGVIVNVSSAATRGIHRIPYSAAKGGINAITASLAVEYADAGIRVVATAPGGTDAPPRRISRGTPQAETDIERSWFQAHIDQTIESSLMKRYGTLDEQASAICFLASDEASYITGTVLPVAGGDLG
ncbi:benzoate 1,2-dioxygenase electron transfer component BenC [Gordonia sp. ABSL1-1]|uniref:benzoate 1,2-dioxygenase electron transfer component BenC n=1 Tax=Gordonia sp. ABSL1-1 TaxID=3053923 RepID=UPI002573AC57|nr:benzoate 1,2-dioxygenase electron transfer component BenC [Gordonia sp. ABSL1-1]MDL9935297.1 benzoate 1,2-dioxygenase electron transfer component BenC [Gordonia sp. ABSL1-1]